MAGAATWLTPHLRARGQYDKARAELADHVLTAVPMDAKANALVIQVRASWIQRHSEIGGPHSDALKALGLRPSVSNLVHVFTFRLPAYSFLSIERNKRSTLMGVVQSTLMPGATDHSIHVSDDGHLALVHIGRNTVGLFADEDAGLREELYHAKAENTEQPPGGAVQTAGPQE